MNNSLVEWGNPPVNRTNRDWAAIIRELMQRPGQWACVGAGSTSLVWKLNRGDVPAFDPTNFEAVCRRNESGQEAIWVRYNPAHTVCSTDPLPDPRIDSLVSAVADLANAVTSLIHHLEQARTEKEQA